MLRSLSATVLAALLTSMPAALAAPPGAKEPSHRVYLIGLLRLSHPHFRLEDGADGPVAIIDIQNRGNAPDRLLGASVDGATTTTLVGGDPDGTLPIGPRATVSLSPAGVHLVTQGWTNPGSADGRLGATLRFARAGDLRVSFRRETEDEPEPASSGAAEDSGKVVDLSR